MDQFNELDTRENEVYIQYNEFITHCIELDIELTEIITRHIELRARYDEAKHGLQARELEANLDIIRKHASKNKATLMSAQADFKTRLEERQRILKGRARLAKMISELKAPSFSQLVAEQSDGAATAEI
ncbi:hypothetical protein SLS64_001559 [Diaporthe eres]